MPYRLLTLTVLLLNMSGCAALSWQNGGTSLQYDGSGVWPDGGWLMHRSFFRQPETQAADFKTIFTKETAS